MGTFSKNGGYRMANTKKLMTNVANTLGLNLDPSGYFSSGNYNGYTIIVNTLSSYGAATKVEFRITAFNPSTNTTLNSANITELINTINSNTRKHFCNATIQNCLLTISFVPNGKMEALVQNICNSIAYVVNYLQSQNYIPCDEISGRTENLVAAVIAGNFHILDSISYNDISKNFSQAQQYEHSIKENFAAGIIGGILGSLVGVLCIVIIGQLNYVAVISGIVMGYATFSLYHKFAKKISWIGIVICFVIMCAMIYFSVQINYAIWLVRTFSDVNFFDAFSYIPQMKDFSSEFASAYNSDLILNYIFSIAGAALTLANLLQANKIKYETKILN